LENLNGKHHLGDLGVDGRIPIPAREKKEGRNIEAEKIGEERKAGRQINNK
jgi:hypothetical protein